MPLLAITRQMDGQAISERLKRATDDRKTTSLAFFQVDFNHSITSSVIDTIRHTSRQPSRLWDELCFFHCRCDGVNGGEEETNGGDDDGEAGRGNNNNNTSTRTTATSATTQKRNMDAIVQVAMAADIFRQLTVRGPAGDDNLTIPTPPQDDNNGDQDNNDVDDDDDNGNDPRQRRNNLVQRRRQHEEVLGQHAFDSIGMALSYNQRLTRIKLSHFNLSLMQAAALGRGLATATCAVEQLILSRMSFCENAITEISMGLKQNRLLHTLAVTSCKLSDNDICSLVFGIINHPSLKVLRLFGNKCRGHGATALAKLLSSPTCKLESLELHYQQDLQPRVPLRIRLLQHFQRQQQERDRQQRQQQQPNGQPPHPEENLIIPQPQRLPGEGNLPQNNNRRLERNGEEGDGPDSSTEDDRLPLATLVQGLRGNKHLRRLNLSNNKLRDNDIASLGEVLWTTNLSCLELEHNDFTEKGLEIFASCDMPSGLKTLRIQGNRRLKPNGSGAQLLIKILKTHIRLESVDSDKFWTKSALKPKIQHWMDYNGGGRALLAATHSSNVSVPSGLWPKVLARVNKKYRISEDRRANVIFSLLQGPVLLEQQGVSNSFTTRKRKWSDTL